MLKYLYSKKLRHHIQKFEEKDCLNKLAIARINTEIRKLLRGHLFVAIYLAIIVIIFPLALPIYLILLLIYPFGLKVEINYFLNTSIIPYTYGETSVGILTGIDYHWPRGGGGIKVSFEFSDDKGQSYHTNVYSLSSELYGIDDLYIQDLLRPGDVINVIFCSVHPARHSNFFNPEMLKYYSLDLRRTESA